MLLLATLLSLIKAGPDPSFDASVKALASRLPARHYAALIRENSVVWQENTFGVASDGNANIKELPGFKKDPSDKSPFASAVASHMLKLFRTAEGLETGDEAQAKALLAQTGTPNGPSGMRHLLLKLGPATLEMDFHPGDGLASIVEVDTAGKSAVGSADFYTAIAALQVGEDASPFDPHHVTGPFAGADVCPVCEYGPLPLAFYWVNDEKDATIVESAKNLQASVVAAGLTKVRAFIIFTNSKNEFKSLSERAEKLAKLANTPNVSFCVINDPDSGHLRNYKVNRMGQSVLYLVKGRKVREAYTNVQPNSLDWKERVQALVQAP